MKHFYILLALTLFAFGCQKDNITQTTQVETEDPIILDNAYVVGKVTDQLGNSIHDVVIELTQNGQVKGSTVSESDGSYSTQNILTDPTQEIVLKFNREDYKVKYRAFENTVENKIFKDVTLANDVGVDSGEEISSPLDTALVKIFGYARYTDGTPIQGVRCTSVWDFQAIASNFFFFIGWSDDITDSDGYWEMYVEKDVMINMKAFYYGEEGSFFTTCQFNFSPDAPLSGNELGEHNIPFVDLGSFSVDTEIELNQDVELVLKGSVVSGVIKQCSGAPIEAGNLIVSLGSKYGDNLLSFKQLVFEDYQFGPNGEFEVNIETCDDPDVNEWGVSVLAHDTIVDWNGYQVYEYNNILNTGDLSLCWDQNDYPGELTVNFEGETYFYDDYDDSAISGKGILWTGASKNDGEDGLSFYIAADDIVLGENPVTWARMWILEWDDSFWRVVDKPFDEEPAENLILTVTDIDGNWVEGKIEGTVAGGKPLTMEFRVYDK